MIQGSREVTLQKRIEAMLFTSNAPLDALDIVAALGDLALFDVQDAIKQLVKVYEMRSTALRIRETRKGRNPAYLLELHDEYLPDVQRMLPSPLEPRLVETLVLVAMNQPVSQARLVRECGSRIYEDVRLLCERGLMRRIKRRSSFTLKTTPRFALEFGLPDEPEQIRQQLASWADSEGILVQPFERSSEEIAEDEAAVAAADELDEEAEPVVAEDLGSVIPAEVAQLQVAEAELVSSEDAVSEPLA